MYWSPCVWREARDRYLSPRRKQKRLPGKFPTLLIRTPYYRAGEGNDYATTFVPHGYVVVEQSVRGRYGSEGRWRLFRDDPATVTTLPHDRFPAVERRQHRNSRRVPTKVAPNLPSRCRVRLR